MTAGLEKTRPMDARGLGRTGDVLVNIKYFQSYVSERSLGQGLKTGGRGYKIQLCISFKHSKVNKPKAVDSVMTIRARGCVSASADFRLQLQ